MVSHPTVFLPLSTAAFQILLALAEGDKHGYAIMHEVASRTGGEVKLHAGTLYTTIRRLVEDDLLVEVAAPNGAGSSDERRRYYRLTAFGRRVAWAELERLRGILEQASATLAPKLKG